VRLVGYLKRNLLRCAVTRNYSFNDLCLTPHIPVCLCLVTDRTARKEKRSFAVGNSIPQKKTQAYIWQPENLKHSISSVIRTPVIRIPG